MNIQRFKRFLEVQGYSQYTIKNYLSSVSLFGRFLERRGKSLGEADRMDVVDFLSEYSAPASRARHLAALRCFYREFLRYPDPVEGLKVHVPRKELEWWLSPEDIRRLLLAAPGPRERALIRLGYDLALRVGEVAGLRLRDVDLTNSEVLIVVEKKRTGHVKRVRKQLYPQTERAIVDWLKVRDRYNPKTDHLFITRNGDPMTPDLINKLLKRIALRAGLPPISFHMLRHSRAAHLREAGVQLDVISRFLAHERLETTMIYAHIGRDALIKMIPPPSV